MSSQQSVPHAVVAGLVAFLLAAWLASSPGQTTGGTASPPSPRGLTRTAAAPMSFVERCAQPGVVKCVGFDSPADFNTGRRGKEGAYGQNHGIYPASGTTDYTRAAMDTEVKASGKGSLRFTVPSNSGADSSGLWFTNFSNDLSVQFGENTEFFVQWRQRFSLEFLTNRYAKAHGWKHVIIGTGDKPGKIYHSCTALEVVMQDVGQRGLPSLYNSCTGSTSHRAYDPFVQRVASSDFTMQNARPAPYCLQSQSTTWYFPPIGNCFGYVPNEWLTYQIHVKIGPRVGDEFVGSYVTLWGARQGQPSEPIIEWGPYNLSAGDAESDQRFGKIWLLPYNTNKDPTQPHPTAYTWYDELIVSRNRIADPL